MRRGIRVLALCCIACVGVVKADEHSHKVCRIYRPKSKLLRCLLAATLDIGVDSELVSLRNCSIRMESRSGYG